MLKSRLQGRGQHFPRLCGLCCLKTHWCSASGRRGHAAVLFILLALPSTVSELGLCASLNVRFVGPNCNTAQMPRKTTRAQMHPKNGVTSNTGHAFLPCTAWVTSTKTLHNLPCGKDGKRKRINETSMNVLFVHQSQMKCRSKSCHQQWSQTLQQGV